MAHPGGSRHPSLADAERAQRHPGACFVAPSPELAELLQKELERVRGRAKGPLLQHLALARTPRPIGLDDGLILPPEDFPLGASSAVMSAAAADRAPLRGAVRVIVVLVDFSDKAMTKTAAHFEELFFSTGALATGSVKEYYAEATHGLVDIVGHVVGPYRMPHTLAWYANGNYGIGRPSGTTRARDMARDAALAADPHVDFGPYDNDGNGYVDAFIVVHAGGGGEQTGNGNHIWSHKWNLPSVHNADGTRIYAYLTIPEDARIGVSAHELGHLLFGFPDLYDTDDTSEGVGNWCLMGGGSWNGGGDTPAHPSAWCKLQQGWASTTNVTTGGSVSIPDVKTGHTVLRLWKDGSGGPEYFLVENRQKTGFDSRLPGAGLLVWHVDETQAGNTNESRYKVGLVQADGKRNLELKQNRGDAGDPYPGSAANTSLSSSSTPSSKSHGGQDSCVSVTAISASGPTMTASIAVSCGKARAKDQKDLKDRLKDTKERAKEQKDLKDRKERKEGWKEWKERRKELKDGWKELKEGKEGKEYEWPGGGRPPLPFERAPTEGAPAEGAPAEDYLLASIEELDARLSALERELGSPAEPFIGEDLRPDLVGGPVYETGDDELQAGMAAGDRDAKRAFDHHPHHPRS